MDQGDVMLAQDLFTRARSSAVESDAAQLVALADTNLMAAKELASGTTSLGLVGQVSGSLRRGDIAGAQRLVEGVTVHTRRERVRARLAEALVWRAQGRLDASAQSLAKAVESAETSGLIRELAVALVAASRTEVMAGRLSHGEDLAQRALGAVRGTHFRVRELDALLQSGFVASELSDLETAAARATEARTLLADVTDASSALRVLELEGAVAVLRGDMGLAERRLRASLEGFTERELTTDAARVSTVLVMVDPSEANQRVAREVLAAAGDPNGEAHVAIAVGRARARGGDHSQAFELFLAAERAMSGSSARERFIARVARENAARSLIALGHRSVAVEGMDAPELLARHVAFVGAEQAYREGHALFEGGAYRRASGEFSSALERFVGLGEVEHARTAEVALGWAEWNQAAAADPQEGLRVFERLVLLAERLGEEELFVRSTVAAAVAAGQVGTDDAPARLQDAAGSADQAGYPDLAGRCWAELAEQPAALGVRASAARAAFGLRPDGVGAYAMYSVAVDAHNLEDFALAVELSTEVLPNAGSLSDAVRAVWAASNEQLQSAGDAGAGEL